MILWTYDWIPLGPLNDVRAVRQQNATGDLAWTTVVQSLPFTVGLVASAAFLGAPAPPGLRRWLWTSYPVLFAGELRAWWRPHLIREEPARAARYRAMFGGTHTFLGRRNGFVPNTLHCLLHGATAATLTLLALRPA